MKTIQELISEYLGISEEEIDFNDPCNYHLSIGQSIDVAKLYAEQFIDKCSEDFIYEPCRDDSYNIYDWEVDPISIADIKKLL